MINEVMMNELSSLKRLYFKESFYILSQMMKFVAKIINLHKCKLGISGLVLKYYIFQVLNLMMLIRNFFILGKLHCTNKNRPKVQEF